MDKKDKNRPRNRVTSQRKRPPTSNYYRSGTNTPENASPFEARLNKVNPFKKFWLRAVDVAAILLLIYLLIHSLIVRSPAQVIANDSSYHSATNYQDSVNNYLKALKNHNKITFDENGIVTSLKSAYPEISTAAVELPVFSQKPIVRIHIAGPSFYLKSGEQEYLVDANGKAVAYRWQYPKVIGLPQVIDQSGYSVSRGRQILSSRDISFLRNLIEHCKSNGIPVQSLVLPSSAQEIDLHTTDKRYFVKFYLNGDSDLQIGQFLAARHEFGVKNINPEQYLDVRISGKIFYK
jgi:cell division septal protein FtsQ